MLKFLSALLIFVSTIQSGVCQFRKIKTFKTQADVSYAAVDRPGDLYLIFGQGTIQKVDTQGKVQHTVSFPVAPAVFDPRDGARIFAYYNDSQQFIFLSPTLKSNHPPYKVDDAFAIHPFLVCSFGEQHILILDSADWSFKKIHHSTSTVTYEASAEEALRSTKELSAMREYQNFIFLIDPNEGILIFNAMGKLLKTVEVKGVRHFNFLGEELYYPENGKLEFFNLFTAETRQIDLPAAADFALLTDMRLYLIRKNEVEVYDIKG